MAKEITRRIKLQIEAGKATPAPPVGTALGPAGINIQEFCTKFNDATREKMGTVIPCEITVYDDRSFDFVIKTPPTSFLLKKYAKIKKGSVKGANEIVATLSEAQIREIAEIKLPDLNAYDVEEAMKITEKEHKKFKKIVKPKEKVIKEEKNIPAWFNKEQDVLELEENEKEELDKILAELV